MKIRHLTADTARLRGGFTLVELLVALAVIGILASLLLPVLSRGRAQAQSIRCNSNLRQLNLALVFYLEANRSKFPFLWQNGPNTCWVQLLEPYLGVPWTNRSWHCPGYRGQSSYASQYGVPAGSYGYNAFGSLNQMTGPVKPRADFLLGLGQGVPEGARDRGVTESQIKVPSQMLAFGDTRVIPTLEKDQTQGSFLLECGGSFSLAPCPERHGGQYNFLFCDGHVNGKHPAVYFNPTNSAADWNIDHQPHPSSW